jgi:hypothetical protein
VWLAFDACERDQDRLDDVKVLAIIARPARGQILAMNLNRAGVIPAIPLSGPLFHPLVLLHCGQRDQVGVKQRF